MAHLIAVIALVSECSLSLVSTGLVVTRLVIQPQPKQWLTVVLGGGSASTATGSLIGITAIVLHGLPLLVLCGSHLVLTTLHM